MCVCIYKNVYICIISIVYMYIYLMCSVYIVCIYIVCIVYIHAHIAELIYVKDLQHAWYSKGYGSVGHFYV